MPALLETPSGGPANVPVDIANPTERAALDHITAQDYLGAENCIPSSQSSACKVAILLEEKATDKGFPHTAAYTDVSGIWCEHQTFLLGVCSVAQLDSKVRHGTVLTLTGG